MSGKKSYTKSLRQGARRTFSRAKSLFGMVDSAYLKSQEINETYDNKKMNNLKANRATLTGAKFYTTSLINANFNQATLRNTLFEYSDLTRAKFNEALQNEVIFNGCNLSDSKFENTTLTNVNFYKSNLTNMNFNTSIIQDTKFTANYSDEKMTNANFESATLKNVKFVSIDFIDANFKNATLRNVLFANVNLRNINFEGAQLINCTFEDCALAEAKFIGASGSVELIVHGPNDSGREEIKIKIHAAHLKRALRETFITSREDFDDLKERVKVLKILPLMSLQTAARNKSTSRSAIKTFFSRFPKEKTGPIFKNVAKARTRRR